MVDPVEWDLKRPILVKLKNNFDSIKIVSMQMSENGMQENWNSSNDLKEGQILQVWYKEGSDSEIENIRYGNSR